MLSPKNVPDTLYSSEECIYVINIIGNCSAVCAVYVTLKAEKDCSLSPTKGINPKIELVSSSFFPYLIPGLYFYLSEIHL